MLENHKKKTWFEVQKEKIDVAFKNIKEKTNIK
jgi:hypothetical protein